MIWNTIMLYVSYAIVAVAFGLFFTFLIALFVLNFFEFQTAKKILIVFCLLVSGFNFFGSIGNRSTPAVATVDTPTVARKEHVTYSPPPTYEPIVFPTLDYDSLRTIEPNKNSDSITFVTYPTSAYPGTRPTVKIKGKPYTTYDITVRYSSGPSRAAGLEPKQSNSEGYVMWSWKVGTNTYAGSYPITVSGDGQEKTIYFDVLP